MSATEESMIEVRIVKFPREVYLEKLVVCELRGKKDNVEAVAKEIEVCLGKKMEVRRWKRET